MGEGSRAAELEGRRDNPDADGAVGVAGEQGGAVCAPGQRDRRRLALLLCPEKPWRVRVQIRHYALVLQIPNFDGILGGSAKPIADGAEAQRVDDGASFESVQLLAII